MSFIRYAVMSLFKVPRTFTARRMPHAAHRSPITDFPHTAHRIPHTAHRTPNLLLSIKMVLLLFKLGLLYPLAIKCRY